MASVALRVEWFSNFGAAAVVRDFQTVPRWDAFTFPEFWEHGEVASKSPGGGERWEWGFAKPNPSFLLKGIDKAGSEAPCQSLCHSHESFWVFGHPGSLEPHAHSPGLGDA